MKIELFYTIVLTICQPSQQNCPEETSHNGISVKWYESRTAFNVESDPVCYHTDNIVTRNCTDTAWEPPLDDVQPCLKVVKYIDLTMCPPGFHRISDKADKYCYQVTEPSTWDYPCLESGGGSVLTDLTEDEFESLLTSLIATNVSRYFWLPAQRQKFFNPVMWAIPGPMWGRLIESTGIVQIQTSFLKNCLILDIEKRTLKTEYCNTVYPSLCFYINELHYPATCPNGYHAFRFQPDTGTCFGVERSEPGLTYEEFVNNKCRKPMEDTEFSDLTRFNFKKVAVLNNLENDEWCWFKASQFNESLSIIEYTGDNRTVDDSMMGSTSLEGVINNAGTFGLIDKVTRLSCMACEAEVNYGETELMLEYNEEENVMYLTVYFPSGLWKYDNNDKGIQCFSNAKGFVRVINITDLPYFEIKSLATELSHIEKIVYTINLIADTSAQYWCEGHSIYFSLITTDKIIVNPTGNEVHVFALAFAYYVPPNEIQIISNNWTGLINNISNIFEVPQVLLMDILEYNLGHIHFLMHLHVPLEEIYEDNGFYILETCNNLKEIALAQFPEYNYTFINVSSSTYCLPNTSQDIFVLDWELTFIGHISAPKQFCLQANGLPVKRHCHGSYLLGGVWGDVEGHCNSKYEPSSTTTFLYNFLKNPNNYTARFLIDGLRHVLDDVDIIIPADIYYLSVSLQLILKIAQLNDSFVDMGDIDNIAWVMDRVMIFDNQYLHLAQTLNSTNVILDSVNNIVEKLAQSKSYELGKQLRKDTYQLAVKNHFVVQISYPAFNNITGIAISNKATTNSFTEMTIQPLYMNTTLNQVLDINNLEIAAWIPTEVIKTLKKFDNSSSEAPINLKQVHIVINVFQNDAVFQEISPNNYSVNSCIIGITIPGFMSNLEYSVPILFKGYEIENYRNTACGYWDFQKQKSSNVPGSWAKQGCFLSKIVNNITVCECYHLTHFGQLIAISDSTNHEVHFPQNHTLALNAITLIGSFLSLIGIVGIWITAMVFKNWRNKAGTKVLLHLSTAIALPLIFIVVFNLDNTIFTKYQGEHTLVTEMRITCIILGALLHYSILASFMWMLITGILQFVRYVRVLGVRRPSRFMAKCTLVGWGTPLIPVIIVLAVNVDNYVPYLSYSKKICYPSGYYLMLGVILPICVILLTNVILFVLVLHAISRGPDGKLKTTDIDLVRTQLRLSIFLFFLLGLTWIFGIFSFSTNLLWSYLFCLTSTLQGFVLFIYFIICDPSTRNMWVTLMRPQFTTSSRNSVTSLSSG